MDKIRPSPPSKVVEYPLKIRDEPMDIDTIAQPGSNLKTIIPFSDNGESSAVSNNSPSMPKEEKDKIHKRGRGA